ncbi:MAG: sugar phosphate isomerase/epimerase [Clostridia bacterium]|nr:sugar phosphate isomerase/epimerase [Clostridia bacterium]
MSYKLGINVPVGHPKMKADEAIVYAKRAGFDSVFLGWSYQNYRIEGAIEAAKKENLIVQSIHAPFNRINTLWEACEVTDIALAEQIACVRVCARVGVPLMVIHPYIGFVNHSPNEFGLENFGKVIREAEKLGVKLAFENVEGEEYLTAIMKEFGSSPNVGFCWDTGHELCYNRGKDMMALYGDKLFGTHFDDNVGVTGEDITYLDDLHLLPFDGIADWKGIMDRIRRHNYNGILTFELTVVNKPDKHTHDEYAKLAPEDFYGLAYERAARVAEL